MQGTPNTMQINPKYDDVLLDIYDFFEKKINFYKKNKIKKELIIIDPGIGFGKNLKHNSFLSWRKRVTSRKTKHLKLRSTKVNRAYCPSQYKQ